MNVCPNKPLTYEHWQCQRRRFHLGRHRFNNYTWRRGARPWRDVRYGWRVVRHWLLREPPWKLPYARTKTQYDPVPFDFNFKERA